MENVKNAVQYAIFLIFHHNVQIKQLNILMIHLVYNAKLILIFLD